MFQVVALWESAMSIRVTQHWLVGAQKKVTGDLSRLHFPI